MAVDTPSLEHKLGQMLLVGFRGTTIATGSVIERDIRDRNIGGVILFSKDLGTNGGPRNIESPAQVRALTDAAKRLASVSLFVSVDQEGGKVARLGPAHGFPATLSAMKMAQLGQAEFERASRALVATIADAGFNLNFAPVVDVNVNPENPVIGKIERSYSSDPRVVTEKAAGVMAAHRQRNVLTSLKHFPGHGSSRADSHLGFTDVTQTWRKEELEPFAALVAAGEVDSVMTAHVFNAKLDPTYPATLSSAVIDGLLRKELGFHGVVFTDDMQMKAIASHYGLETAIHRAVLAGADVLTFGNNVSFDENIAEKVIGILKRLVAAGEISEARIDVSYERIMTLKRRLAGAR